MTFTMTLVGGKEDIVVISGDYCKDCAWRKLNVLQHWTVTKEDVQRLVRWGTKVVKVRDECQ